MRLLAAALLLLSSTPAQARKVLIGTPRVSFAATGSPGALSFEGRTEALQLEEQDDAIRLTVPLDTVKTGIALRDRHLRETYVQTAAFPDAVLIFPVAALTLPAPGEPAARGTGEGAFTVHGVTRPVQVAWSARSEDPGWRIEASFPFDVSQHGIAVPSYLGVTVAPAMRAEARLRVVEAPD